MPSETTVQRGVNQSTGKGVFRGIFVCILEIHVDFKHGAALTNGRIMNQRRGGQDDPTRFPREIPYGKVTAERQDSTPTCDWFCRNFMEEELMNHSSLH